MMHEPIQAKGPTMSEKLMEQYRLHGQRKRRNACIAAIVTVVLVLAVAGGVWWTAGDGNALVRNMFKPKATPATQPVVNSTATFAYRTAPEFLAMEAGDRGTGNVNYSPASMWMALAIAAQGANGTTRSQLNELLGSGSLTDSDYQSLLSSINGQYSGAKSEMSAANSLWIDDDYSCQRLPIHRQEDVRGRSHHVTVRRSGRRKDVRLDRQAYEWFAQAEDHAA